MPKQYSAEFKAKVALEAIRELRTTSEIANNYGVSRTLIDHWKKRLLHGAIHIFSQVEDLKEQEDLFNDIYKQIEKLSTDLDDLGKEILLNRE
ncbi:transposase [Leptolyngbya sp. NK1-12]|uniref:Transposase n=1 Tax=Leptolyngbya sp. NK1-12 TaxID=2547451 RepID=A0AA96WLZ5_9CYAN|nr:transposase [Leptolyngbya sp. NK1-12]